ncbi:hypothetical protein BRSU_2837 [Brachyspira suanatina]|uniref:Uncharacterized protein n=1 Tax=Brachyspira suanatina TaxID=381802 RepID=A0A0G4KAR9_9SPIR|nr:hypothetical protein [Brachyspira suanatina]CRF35745.1 hypothetical protein BRSU_2837 [Brachyspira suanatina]
MHDEYLRSQASNDNQNNSNDDYISKFKEMNEEYVESHKQDEIPQEKSSEPTGEKKKNHQN